MAAKDEGALLVQPELDDAMPFADVEELRSLIAESRERGYVTPNEIAAVLEEHEPSVEQVSEVRPEQGRDDQQRGNREQQTRGAQPGVAVFLRRVRHRTFPVKLFTSFRQPSKNQRLPRRAT